MARLAAPAPDALTPAQQRLSAAVGGKRSGGAARGPWGVLLHRPALMEKAAALGDYIRDDMAVAPKLRELAVIAVARHYGAPYEWHAHARSAREAGLDAAVIEAVRTRTPPPFADEAEAATHALAAELLATRAVSGATYDRAVAALGEAAVIELVTAAGFYALVATILVVFDIEAPDGAGDVLPA
ncbi:MAG: carboxymuconolactone decarboxylase family protein [Alphaproteobacteria bacterium]|nr:carboxymuconolactone decarboxylase family protein [Alphaproteobacteria bacterium]